MVVKALVFGLVVKQSVERTMFHNGGFGAQVPSSTTSSSLMIIYNLKDRKC